MIFPRIPILEDRRRLCLVAPPVTPEDRYGPMASAGNSLPPHAFLYLGAVAREAGWDVTIIDAPAESLGLNNCTDAILKTDPSVVGFTVTTMSVAKAAHLAEEIGQRAPEVVRLVGERMLAAGSGEVSEALIRDAVRHANERVFVEGMKDAKTEGETE